MNEGQMTGLDCPLTDDELIEAVMTMNAELARTGAKTERMHIPVDLRRDSDVLIAEIARRFRERCSRHGGELVTRDPPELGISRLMAVRLENERQTLQVIDERDRAQDLITEVAEYFGCDEEWSSAHSHFNCVRDAIQLPAPEPSADVVESFVQIGEVNYGNGTFWGAPYEHRRGKIPVFCKAAHVDPLDKEDGFERRIKERKDEV